MVNSSQLHSFSAAILPLLLAITLHEAAHAWVAKLCGDKTAHSLGRVSLNPLKHIDPIGTLLLPAILLLSGAGFLFGWAKPVPVNIRHLNKPRRDMALVALAGPGANLLMSIIWAVILFFTLSFYTPLAMKNTGIAAFLSQTAVYGIYINIILLVLNMLPIPPLDGSKVLASVLPTQQARIYEKISPYGLFILIGILACGALNQLFISLNAFNRELIDIIIKHLI